LPDACFDGLFDQRDPHDAPRDVAL
jgi:hypothetical protein